MLDDIAFGKINVYYRKPKPSEYERMLDVAGAYFEKHTIVDADLDYGLWLYYGIRIRELYSFLSDIEDPINYGWSIGKITEIIHTDILKMVETVIDYIEDWPEALDNMELYQVKFSY